MVWPFSKGSSSPTVEKQTKPSTTTETTTTAGETEKPAIYLEDLPPKFEDQPGPVPGAPDAGASNKPTSFRGSPQKIDPNQSIVKQAVSSISVSDFAEVNKMPCFRNAMLTGGSVGAVAFAVLISTRSPFKRALNWTMAGFTIGSIGSWEQCRYKLRQERKTQEMARQIYKNREKQQSKDGKKPEDN